MNRETIIKIKEMDGMSKQEHKKFTANCMVAKMTSFNDFNEHQDYLTDALLGECIESDTLCFI